MSTALVLVSHSRAVAEGTAEIARQMAPDVTILPAGGIDGDIGTSYELVLETIERATADGGGLVVLTDLGSAVLTAESVLESLDDDVAARVRLADAPFVEGAVAAAVEAQTGAGPEAVEAAAVRAVSLFTGPDESRDGAAASPSVDPATPEAPPAGSGQPLPGRARATVVLPNALGLHARPAAVLARAVAALGVPVTIDGVNGASVLELMQLGAAGGHELVVQSEGPGAEAAVEAVVTLVTRGFGEV